MEPRSGPRAGSTGCPIVTPGLLVVTAGAQAATSRRERLDAVRVPVWARVEPFAGGLPYGLPRLDDGREAGRTSTS